MRRTRTVHEMIPRILRMSQTSLSRIRYPGISHGVRECRKNRPFASRRIAGTRRGEECQPGLQFPTNAYRCPTQDLRDHYDVVVIGGGLGGMTAANVLARAGRSVLLAEQHHKLGGLATWFRRGDGRVFDVALHGFPGRHDQELPPLLERRNRRLDRPVEGHPLRQPDVLALDHASTARISRGCWSSGFACRRRTSRQFFDAARNMNFYDDQATTTGQLFERFFPGRGDVVRLLMEPITYANGSTLEDPALSYGIVFSNFMSKGVYTFQGGTDRLIGLMGQELKQSGVDVRTRCAVEKIHVGPAAGVGRASTVCGGRHVKTRAVVSNANLLGTIFNLVGPEHWDRDFLEQARAVR